jgi:hypothetical protein
MADDETKQLYRDEVKRGDERAGSSSSSDAECGAHAVVADPHELLGPTS